MSISSSAIGSMILVAIAFGQTAIADDMTMPKADAKATAPSSADKKLIESAMQAAPRKVSRAATIVVMNDDGTMRTLREGANGFTCMPAPNAMCLDKAAMQWLSAYLGHKTPAAGAVGFMYMLAGEIQASNTDPYAEEPAPSNHWIKTGPHVMIVGADPSFYDMYPKSADPDTSVPYVMWAGTPYQHLMIPVK